MRVDFTDNAKRDLRNVALHIARDNKPRAQTFVRQLRRKAAELGSHPRAFPLPPGYERKGIRRRVFRDCPIF